MELSAIITALPNTNGQMEYFGTIPRLDVGFSGKTAEEAKGAAARLAKMFIEGCHPDYQSYIQAAVSLEARIKDTSVRENGGAIPLNRGFKNITCKKWPEYIQTGKMRINFYQFTANGVSRGNWA